MLLNCDFLLGLLLAVIEPMSESIVSTVEERTRGSLEMVENGVEGYFKRQVILRKILKLRILLRFLNPWYFMEVFKPMVFNKGFYTHDILRRF